MEEGKTNFHQIRDDKMTDNLFFAMEQLPEDAKFFGQFGAEHILQSEMITTFVLQENYNRFAMQLQEDDSPVKGEVCSIYLVFLQKSQSPRSTNYYLMNESEIPIDSFQDYYAQDTFIPLDEKGSPFGRYGEAGAGQRRFWQQSSNGSDRLFPENLVAARFRSMWAVPEIIKKKNRGIFS